MILCFLGEMVGTLEVPIEYEVGIQFFLRFMRCKWKTFTPSKQRAVAHSALANKLDGRKN